MKQIIRSLPAAALLLAVLLATSLVAHHSITAEYDVAKQTDYSGTVEGAPQLVNPHATFQVRVAKPDGSTELWTFEMGSATALAQAGWRRDTLKAGDTVTITGVPAKDGTPHGATLRIRWADGRMIENTDPWWTMSPMGLPTPSVAPARSPATK